MSTVRPAPGRMLAEVEQAACQQGVGTKAFTGKGTGFRQIRQAQVRVDDIHAQMQELSEATRKVSGRLFYLALHKRSKTGQLSVRWRQAGCARSTHLAWDDMEGLFSRVPKALADWYKEADKLARQLNRDEQIARLILKQAEEALAEEQGRTP